VKFAVNLAGPPWGKGEKYREGKVKSKSMTGEIEPELAIIEAIRATNNKAGCNNVPFV